MQNLCGDPKEHFKKHCLSKRRLVNNKPQRCGICDGYGYLVMRRLDRELMVEATYTICQPCNGTGKAVNV